MIYERLQIQQYIEQHPIMHMGEVLISSYKFNIVNGTM